MNGASVQGNELLCDGMHIAHRTCKEFLAELGRLALDIFLANAGELDDACYAVPASV